MAPFSHAAATPRGLIPTRLVSTNNVTEKRQSTPSHLDGIDDGCGCVEVWEHTSDHRDEPAEDGSEVSHDASEVSPDDAGEALRDDTDDGDDE